MLVQADAPALQEAGREEVEVPPDIGLDGVGYGWRQGGRFNGRHRLSGSQDGLFVQLVDLAVGRSEEHTSELQSLMRISYAVFCLKKKKNKNTNTIKRKYKNT